MMRRVRSRSWLEVMGVGLGLLLSSLIPVIASAHSKEITIEVSVLPPDPQQPHTWLYRANVFFSGDGDPVERAVITLSAQRRQGGKALAPVHLKPLNVPGIYAAQVSYPRYGTWDVKLELKEPEEAQVSFAEEVLPPALPRETALEEADQKSIFTFSLSFNWQDVANLGMRWIHSVAAAVWFGLSGVVVAVFWLLDSPSRAQFLRRLNPLFPWLAWASLAFLTGTGVYNAIYNSPIRPPGALSFFVMERIPYGTTYLVTLGLKAIAVGVSIALALGMAKGLKSAALSEGGNPIPVSTKRDAPLLSLAAVNLAVGVIMMLSVSVLIYLHNLSHLAVLVPGR